jgi:N-acetylmuramoyl-L-alanine amidase
LFEGTRGPGRLARSWLGRDETGQPVAEGPYRIVLTAQADADAHADAAAAVESAVELETWVTVADRAVYPPGPTSITVAVDPGHGGLFDGAVGADGTREADLNLDIGLRLARMLEGSGVDVVLTRKTDSHVNEPPADLTADGIIDETDELAARPDLANAARADLFIAVHNNIAVDEGVGGPSTFYFDERTFGDRSRRLARLIQSEMVAALGTVAPAGWQPFDHGALIYPYYVLRDYDPPRLLHPTQMPGVLSEGLFLSNPRELRLLKQPRVRQAMAAAYYEAIARYLALRGAHVGYRLIESPAGAPTGEPVRLRVEVRNQGSEPMRAWDVIVGALPSDSSSVGRARSGGILGRQRIPELRPGGSASLDVELAAPTPGGRWTLMVDAVGPSGERVSRSGSPMLHVPLTTLDPLPASVCCLVVPDELTG